MQDREKITHDDLLAFKQCGRKITMLSIYDYATARIADENGLDTILVGDSLGESRPFVSDYEAQKADFACGL